jgi:poly-gamma-glutamate synthesis protein (capsule biosynthesis protein)
MAERVVSIAGDVMFHTQLDQLRCAGDGFESALTELERSDLVIANLEMPLSRRGYRVPKYANIRSDPEMIDGVRAMGIDVVSMANNHMMDYGPDAMFDTIAACDRTGIAHAGAGPDLEAAFAPAWLDVGGARVGMLSAACTLPVESDAAPGKPGIAPVRVGFAFEVDPNLMAEQPGTVPTVQSWVREEAQEELCRRVRDMKAQADVAIVVMHWGVPSYWLSPAQGPLAAYQRPVAHAIIEAGADLIAGNHPHGLNPVEIYHGKPIFYSLGNFVYEDLWDFMGPESILVRLSLDRGTVELVPVLLNERGIPRCATGDEADTILGKLDTMSSPYGTRISIENHRGYPIAASTPPVAV